MRSRPSRKISLDLIRASDALFALSSVIGATESCFSNRRSCRYLYDYSEPDCELEPIRGCPKRYFDHSPFLSRRRMCRNVYYELNTPIHSRFGHKDLCCDGCCLL